MSPMKRIPPVVVLAVAALLAFATHVTDVAAQGQALSVIGRASVEVAPDRARVTFAVETEAEGARQAGEANAALIDRVVAALLDSGVPDLRIETSGYMVTPRHTQPSPDEPRRIIGYTAINMMRVVVDEVEAVGRLVDTALDAGANRVSGISFELEDPTPHEMTALRMAVEQARGEAEVVAEALGMRLGAPVSVQSGAAPAQPFTQLQGRVVPDIETPPPPEMLPAPPTAVRSGLVIVNAHVTIHYRLDP